jgi:hypothetical protein
MRKGDDMQTTKTFRFLSIASALILWMGALATADERIAAAVNESQATSEMPSER